MSPKCEECRRAGLQCELDCYPCSNCTERGYGDDCPGRSPHTEPSPLSDSASLMEDPPSQSRFNRCIICINTIVSTFFSPLIQVYQNPKSFLRFLYLPILLFLPMYYISQASTVLDSAEKCKEEYDEWIGVLSTRIRNLDVAASSSATLTNSGDIELQHFRYSSTTTLVPSERGRTPESILVPPANPTLAAYSPLVQEPPPKSVVKVKEDWLRFIDSRIVEWKIAATTACVFVAASPTIFQIPDASDDPITRSIAFLALCRALSGIVYGPIFPIYFRGMRTKNAHFAMLWAREAKKCENSIFWGPWVMLSLPAVATCWATIFFLLAIFAFIWRTGSTADPSDWPTSTPGRPPMAWDLALALRIIITSITVIDLCCMVWIWRTLRRYNNDVWRDQDGGDAFPPSPGIFGRPSAATGNLTP